MFLSGCLSEQKIKGRIARPKTQDTVAENDHSSGNKNSSRVRQVDGDEQDGQSSVVPTKSDIQHIVDPFDGTYKTKVTIPKNYKGLLYLSGLNISALTDKIVSVRFRFGREGGEVIIPASIGRAPGITPYTDIEVLILDLSSSPFRDVRLPYDLFDYTDYDSNDDRVEFDPRDNLQTPVNDPRAQGLYCRGLKVEDDPTFKSNNSDVQCNNSGERCLYAYAKIQDASLYRLNDNIFTATVPKYPAIATGEKTYSQQSEEDFLQKCLPDTNLRSSNQATLQTRLTGSNSNLLSHGNTAFSGDYQYRGPFRPINRFEWEITDGALLSDISTGAEPTGLFQAAINSAPSSAEGGFKSFLFPRAGKMELRAGVEYIGYNDIDGERSIKSLVSAGESEHMDGCNIRAANKNPDTNEGISSCNVTATIELTYIKRGQIKVITTSKAVKLQLIRPSLKNYQGREVLYSAFRNCSDNQGCSVNECCFNSRCWSNELVSKCSSEEENRDNLPVGQVCTSDLECASLCCNPATRTCAVHSSLDKVLCSKPFGQSCLTKSFCRQENVQNCFKVKTGTDLRGGITCAIRCYNIPTYGDCINGLCRPPKIPGVPTLGGNCQGAIDPPRHL